MEKVVPHKRNEPHRWSKTVRFLSVCWSIQW